MNGTLKGLVRQSTGSWYSVQDESGTIYQARIKGKMRLTEIKTTNPIAVGDWVDFMIDSTGECVIKSVLPRKNYIVRRSVNLSKQKHVLAANIDLAVVLVTLKTPKTSLGFIDRFTITCEAYQIPMMIVFNKLDLLDEQGHEELNRYRKLYESLGYPTLGLCAHEQSPELEHLKNQIKNKTCMIMGHSGVGKSTLVNALDSSLNLKTKSVSEFNDKGQHTTTFATMYAWPFGGNMIDTPGIKEFGLVDIEKQELSKYFVEWRDLALKCRFGNCMHLNEPQCQIVKSLEEGVVFDSRYESYLKLLEDCI